MQRIERIEPILRHLAMDEPSASIITGNHQASQQSANYSIVNHEWKGKKIAAPFYPREKKDC